MEVDEWKIESVSNSPRERTREREMGRHGKCAAGDARGRVGMMSFYEWFWYDFEVDLWNVECLMGVGFYLNLKQL